MTPFLIDSHCHLHFPAYAEDLDAVLARMKEKNIAGITIGTALGNSKRGLGFAETHDGIWATAGVHPEHFTSDFLDENEGEVEKGEVSVEVLEAIVTSSAKCVGIGETGLDFYRVDEGLDATAARQKQEDAFRVHLEVARKLDLPLVLHCRDALMRLAEIFQEEFTAGRKYRAVVHSFTGTWEEAKSLLDLGLSIAVNGIATFPIRKNQRPEDAIDRTIERIPFDRLLLETDSPYLAPAPYRGKRNEPAYVEEVAKHAAKVRGVELKELAEKTVQNTMALFRLPG